MENEELSMVIQDEPAQDPEGSNQEPEEQKDVFSTYFETQPVSPQPYPAGVYPPVNGAHYVSPQPTIGQPVPQQPLFQQPAQQQTQALGTEPQEQKPLFNMTKEEAYEILDNDPVKFMNMIAEVVQKAQQQAIAQTKQELLHQVTSTIQSRDDVQRVNNIVQQVQSELSKQGYRLNDYQFSSVYNYLAHNIDDAYQRYRYTTQDKMMKGIPLDPNELDEFGNILTIDNFCVRSAVNFGSKIAGKVQKVTTNPSVRTQLPQIHDSGMVGQKPAKDILEMTDEERDAYARSKGWKVV